MERKIVLEIEELEERIAPHCPLGFSAWEGSAPVKYHEGYLWMASVPGEGVENTVILPPQAANGLGQFDANGAAAGCGEPVPPGQQNG